VFDKNVFKKETKKFERDFYFISIFGASTTVTFLFTQLEKSFLFLLFLTCIESRRRQRVRGFLLWVENISAFPVLLRQ
jgi:hypothetical protein